MRTVIVLFLLLTGVASYSALPARAFTLPKLEAVFNVHGQGTGQFQEADGLAVDTDGMKIYVVARAPQKVVSFSADGQFLWEWGDDSQLNGPTDIAFANEMVFVANTYARTVKILSTAGSLIATYGSNDDGYPNTYDWGLVLSLEAVRVSGTTFLMILFSQDFRPYNGYVQFWRVGSAQHPLTYVSEYPLTRVGFPNMNTPYHVSVAPDLTTFVSYLSEQAIQVYDAQGRFQYQFGAVGRDDDRFINPMGLTYGSDGNLYITDRRRRTACGGYSVQVYSPQGLYVGSWCTRAPVPEFPAEDSNYSYATDLAFSPMNGALFVLESGGHIKRYSFAGTTAVQEITWSRAKGMYR